MKRIERIISKALKNIEKGNNQTALKDLLESIEYNPENSELLRLIGIIYILEKQLNDAYKYFKLAINEDPNDRVSLANLIKILLDQERQEEAYLFGKKLVEIDKSEESLVRHSAILEKLAKKEELLEVTQKLLEINPLHEQALLIMLDNAIDKKNSQIIYYYIKLIIENYKNNETTEKAIKLLFKNKIYDPLIELYRCKKIEPSSLVLKEIIANSLSETKNFNEAYKEYSELILHNPNNEIYLAQAGYAIGQIGNPKKELEFYEKALKINPKYVGVLTNIGVTHIKEKRYTEGKKYLQEAVKVDDKYGLAWSNLGDYFYKILDESNSLAAFQKATELDKNNVTFLTNLGAAWELNNNPTQALLLYNQALAIEPNYSDAINNRGHLYLGQMNFEMGWPDYEARFHTKEYNSKILETTRPLWRGEPNLSGPLYIWAEQGIGDQILHGSILADLKNLPFPKIIDIPKKLIPIFKRSFPEYKFFDRSINQLSENQYAAHIPIASLGQFFKKSMNDFKKQLPFLIDDINLTHSFRKKLKNSEKIVCGLSWKSINDRVGDEKSIVLDKLLPILSLKHFDFVNLQYGDVFQEINDLESRHHIKIKNFDDIDAYNDIDKLGSLIQACDIVVTISNTTAHLAGAMGKKTFLLLPKHMGKFWYWHSVEKKSLWYPSVEIFQQNKQSEWSGPIDEIRKKLENLGE